MDQLQIIYRPPSELSANPRNVRVHTASQVEKLGQAIRRFGFTNPIIVDADGMVLCGHGRLQAATKLGLASIPTVRIDHMSAAQKRALVIADNKLSDESRFDNQLLAVEFEELLQAPSEQMHRVFGACAKGALSEQLHR